MIADKLSRKFSIMYYKLKIRVSSAIQNEKKKKEIKRRQIENVLHCRERPPYFIEHSPQQWSSKLISMTKLAAHKYKEIDTYYVIKICMTIFDLTYLTWSKIEDGLSD